MAHQLDFFGQDDIATEWSIAKLKEEQSSMRRALFARHGELEKSYNLLLDIVENLADRIIQLENKKSKIKFFK
jgi:hypothetical protein